MHSAKLFLNSLSSTVGAAPTYFLAALQVLVVKSSCEHLPNRYFRVMDPEMPMCVGDDGRLYEEDEYDMFVLEKGYKPFHKPSKQPVSLQ